MNDDDIPAVALKRRRDDPPIGDPTRSGSGRHWKPGMEAEEEKIVGWKEETAIFSINLFGFSLYLSLWGLVRCVRAFSMGGFLKSQNACRFAFSAT